MKILFWTDGFWPRVGGVETQSLAFIREMQERGHEYKVIAQQDHPSWNEEEMVQGVQIRRFDFNSIIKSRNLNIISSIIKFIEFTLQNFKPDIIHLNTTVGGSLFTFLLCRSRFHIPVILTAYTPCFCLGHFSALVEKAMHSVDHICCISDWVLQEIQQRRPLLKNKLRRIYCGLSTPKIVATLPPFSPPTLLILGRLSWEKGFDTMIRAFALLQQSGSKARLIVAGGGVEKPALEKLAHDLHVNGSIEFTGVLNQADLLTMYAQATLVIVPSIHESFGLVILEAMQVGRPVIASRVEGIPEVVAEGETGLLVPIKEPKALSAAIQILLNNPEKAIEMGLKGRQRALQFTLDQNATQYEQLYKELMGRRSYTTIGQELEISAASKYPRIFRSQPALY